MGTVDGCDNYILVDVGANLVNKKFTRDMESVIQRAKDAGKLKLMILDSKIYSLQFYSNLFVSYLKYLKVGN